MTKNLGGNALAKEIFGVATGVTNENARFPVVGTLNDSMDLMLDGFSQPIPSSDYYVWQPRINLYTRPVPTVDDSSYGVLSNDYREELYLKPTDRVLCLPIEDGHTFVILGHIKGGLAP